MGRSWWVHSSGKGRETWQNIIYCNAPVPCISLWLIKKNIG
jgi:hypothetical protein